MGTEKKQKKKKKGRKFGVLKNSDRREGVREVIGVKRSTNTIHRQISGDPRVGGEKQDHDV